MQPTNPPDYGPAMTLYFAHGIAVRAGFLLLRDQEWTLGVIAAIFGHAPDPLPDDQYAEWLGDQFSLSQVRVALGPEVDDLHRRLADQQQLSARLGEES